MMDEKSKESSWPTIKNKATRMMSKGSRVAKNDVVWLLAKYGFQKVLLKKRNKTKWNEKLKKETKPSEMHQFDLLFLPHKFFEGN